ncbi:MAG: cupin domain-containing protein [bacterium]
MVGNVRDLPGLEIRTNEAKAAVMKVLVSPAEGWDSHVLRVIEVGVGGYTPKHRHPWPHINYVIEGEGELMINGQTTSVTAGSYAFVPGDELHQFRNAGQTTFRFLCIVPKEGHKV